ncbi:YqaE/Pmp3 family membrane protein [Pontibacter sp. JH31]|uniref:YqaE/Pmp3 family membrane protein n=1 Tax=Pontibacter aquaedesilientis TaxID=2766980 RepID=A0ABR7XLA6_9BACT|nr:YqaE/Pmp3 family membrane protein [Pontibacter aquaedesilientis]
MGYLLAIIFPFLSLMVNGKIFSGIICLILQCTILGWFPAAIWAIVSLNNQRAEKRTNRIIKAIKEGKQLA